MSLWGCIIQTQKGMALASLRDIIISLQVNMCLNVLLIRDKLLNRGLGRCLATTVTAFMTRSWSSDWGGMLFCCSITWFCREKIKEDRTGNSLWQSVLRIKIYGSKIRSPVTAVQILPGLNKTGDEVAENWVAWTKTQKEKCNTETARSGTSDKDFGWREAWRVCVMSAFCLQRVLVQKNLTSQDIVVSKNEAPITFGTMVILLSQWLSQWHPQCFQIETGFEMCLLSCGCHFRTARIPMIACFSAQFFPSLPQFGGLQYAFPWAAAGCHHILISHSCGNFWGLCCCAGPAWKRTGRVLSRTAFAWTPSSMATHLAYTEHPRESHLDGAKGQSWRQALRLVPPALPVSVPQDQNCGWTTLLMPVLLHLWALYK